MVVVVLDWINTLQLGKFIFGWRSRICVIIRLESTLQPNIRFTLRRVLAVFTRSAITPSKVNRFRWNLEHCDCEYIVGGWPWQILGTIHHSLPFPSLHFSFPLPLLFLSFPYRSGWNLAMKRGPICGLSVPCYAACCAAIGGLCVVFLVDSFIE